MERRVAVIGLGYVGLPVALGFARKFPGTLGFDIDARRVKELQSAVDASGETEDAELANSSIKFTSDPALLKGADFFVVSVPTPVDENRNPDLTALELASKTVAQVMQKGAIVVYESTVYPGVTEEFCGPVLAKESGLRQGVDFTLGYSPERINPGDKEHTLERIIKVVSGENAATLNVVSEMYGSIVPAGVHQAPSIRVAEAAKVIENTQRDLNIALMNELALIFDRLGIRTRDVLAAAETKWNFLRFRPGLVGGHCIGVDPYYLTTKAEQLGYSPQVILAGRRINDGMGIHVAQRVIKLMVNQGLTIKGSRVGILGAAFKEDVPDLRNSRVPDIVSELREFGAEPLVYDPLVSRDACKEEYGIDLCAWADLKDLDALVYAVNHSEYASLSENDFSSMLNMSAVFADVKSVCRPDGFREDIAYWCL
jgi:UDP-N-acetyl-D-galactosamine dehydrogenase